MRTEKLNYELPADLIAQTPTPDRTASKLLVIGRDSGELVDSQFSQLSRFLKSGDCLVLNDTKVLPARFFGRRKTGAKIEGLFLTAKSTGIWQVMLKHIRKLKPGEKFYLKDIQGYNFCTAEVTERLDDAQCLLRVDSNTAAEEILNKIGFAPLPPYIKRGDNNAETVHDRQRYQTIYARRAGAIAAPTAGLHFTEKLIAELKEAGIHLAYLTLHVGAGTFKPVTAEDLKDHEMHFESFELREKDAAIINETRANAGRVIAVGTTAVRTLETVAEGKKVKPAAGQTDLFIIPGYEFKMIDAMITNFHLPKSTLLALVGAFAGMENIMAAYRHAIKTRYRFYSYGDAMLIV